MATASQVMAGAAFVKLTMDSAELYSGIEKAQSKVKRFCAAINDWSTKVSLFAVVLQLPFKKALDTFSEFDLRMRQVQTITNASSTAVEKMSDAARKLGRETSFATNEIAEAMVALGRLGLSASEVEKAIKPVMNLSRATGGTLAQAAQLAGTQMRVFGKSVDELGDVTDIITFTVNRSAMDINDFQEAVAKAGPTFANTKADMMQMAASLGILANMGVRGSIAGNALARAFKRLAMPQVEALLNSYGVSAREINGNLRPLHHTLADVAKIMATMNTATRVRFAEEIFEVRGALAGLPLAIKSKEIDAFLSELGEIEGVAQRSANAMDQGLWGALKRLSSALNDAYISLGKFTGVNLALTSFVEGLAKSINMITNSSGYLAYFAKFGVVLSGVVAFFGAMTKGAIMFGTAIKSIYSPLLRLDKLLTGIERKNAFDALKKRYDDLKSLASAKAASAAQDATSARRAATTSYLSHLDYEKALKNEKNLGEQIGKNKIAIKTAEAQIRHLHSSAMPGLVQIQNNIKSLQGDITKLGSQNTVLRNAIVTARAAKDKGAVAQAQQQLTTNAQLIAQKKQLLLAEQANYDAAQQTVAANVAGAKNAIASTKAQNVQLEQQLKTLHAITQQKKQQALIDARQSRTAQILATKSAVTAQRAAMAAEEAKAPIYPMMYPQARNDYYKALKDVNAAKRTNNVVALSSAYTLLNDAIKRLNKTESASQAHSRLIANQFFKNKTNVNLLGIAISKHSKLLSKTSLADIAAAARSAGASRLRTAALVAEAVATKSLAAALALLKKAFMAIVSNPMTAGLALIAGALALISKHINDAKDSATALAERSADELESTQKNTEELKKRQKQFKKDIKYLVELEKQGYMTSEQQSAAVKIVEALSLRYGDLGIVLDALTGKITGAAKAQKFLNEQMKAERLMQIQEEMNKIKNNINANNDVVVANAKTIWGAVTNIDGVAGKRDEILKSVGYHFVEDESKRRIVNTNEGQRILPGPGVWRNLDLEGMADKSSEEIHRILQNFNAAYYMAKENGYNDLAKALKEQEDFVKQFIEKRKEYNSLMDTGIQDEEEAENKLPEIQQATTLREAMDAQKEMNKQLDKARNKNLSQLDKEIQAIKDEREEYEELAQTAYKYYENEKRLAEIKLKDLDAPPPAGSDVATGLGVYGKGNISLYDAPVLKDGQGNYTSFNPMGFNEDGKWVLIPTIAKGLDGIAKELSSADALKRYRDTDEYLGKFDTQEEMNAYSQKLLEQQQALRDTLNSDWVQGKIAVQRAEIEMDDIKSARAEMEASFQSRESKARADAANRAIVEDENRQRDANAVFVEQQKIADERRKKILDRQYEKMLDNGKYGNAFRYLTAAMSENSVALIEAKRQYSDLVNFMTNHGYYDGRMTDTEKTYFSGELSKAMENVQKFLKERQDLIDKQDQLRDASQNAESKLTSAGSFSVAALFRSLNGTNVQERIAIATRESANRLAKIETNTSGSYKHIGDINQNFAGAI